MIDFIYNLRNSGDIEKCRRKISRFCFWPTQIQDALQFLYRFFPTKDMQLPPSPYSFAPILIKDVC